jgi:ATP-dependent RNA helicase RhlE
MYHPSSGRSRSFSPRRAGGRSAGGFAGRSAFRRGGGPAPSHINPDRYVNQASEPLTEVAFVPEHTFADFGLSEQLLQNIKDHGYTTPTPIQDQAILPVMAGKDVVGIANTGTGKTAAFLLPLIHKLTLDSQAGVLIVIPTRELAIQIHDEFRHLANGVNLSAVLCVGGTNINPQIGSLRKRPHFVIGTPGRLKDLVNRRALDLSDYANIVLDEVDRMLDIGFRPDIQFLINQLPAPRQSLFFSATMSGEIEQIMRSFAHEPVEIRIKSAITSNHIDQDVVKVPFNMPKFEVLANLLLQQDEYKRVIVFGRTKHGINKLEEILSERGLKVSSIHGNKTQGARQRALTQFKQGQVQALLATDVAARGIDIDNVSHVINYDEPATYQDYIHRIGRTGRAGRVGKALTFVG